MLISFFESFKYLGLVWPVAGLRIYAGYYFLTQGIDRIHQNFLQTAALQEILSRWAADGPHNERYLSIVQNFVIPNWQPFSVLIVAMELIVGLSFILGFMVRPFAIVAILLNFIYMMGAPGDVIRLNQVFVAVNVTLFMVAAGRCVGFDYYFFKRIRGFWW